jgi:hypothetical protein
MISWRKFGAIVTNRISSGEEPERWSLTRALREKAGWTEAQLAELEAFADQDDRVELLMRVEEEFGIEIDDEELRPPSDGGHADGPPS